MAVPKRRKSQARRNTRRAQHRKPPLVTLSLCPRCREPKLPHRVCQHCGFYGDKDILHLEETKHGT